MNDDPFLRDPEMDRLQAFSDELKLRGIDPARFNDLWRQQENFDKANPGNGGWFFDNDPKFPQRLQANPAAPAPDPAAPDPHQQQPAPQQPALPHTLPDTGRFGSDFFQNKADRAGIAHEHRNALVDQDMRKADKKAIIAHESMKDAADEQRRRRNRLRR